MEYFEFRAMNSQIVFAAEGNPNDLQQAFQEARAAMEAEERRFTRFCETSELSALNRASGEWVSVSRPMYQVVELALMFAGETGGLFDPSILDALKAAGYDRSMDEIKRNGVQLRRGQALVRPADIHSVELDPDRSAIRLPRGLHLDLGGIAKGWIAERAAYVLEHFADACAVSAGGDMCLLGLPEGETAWEVGLEDPLDPERDLATLRVGPGAVATSSVAKRKWQVGDKKMHHLIDPRTRQPAETDWLSVTVMAPELTTAEAYAKSLLIAGPGEAEKLAARRGDIRFIAIDSSGELRDFGEVLKNGYETLAD